MYVQVEQTTCMCMMNSRLSVVVQLATAATMQCVPVRYNGAISVKALGVLKA
jgi:hypothetical protein